MPFPLRPLRGRLNRHWATGGVAARSHRLMARTPTGFIPAVKITGQTKLVHLNPSRLGFLSLVKRDLEHAVLQFRVDGFLVHRRRQREAAKELAVAAFV